MSKPTEKQIVNTLELANDRIYENETFSGMTYEMGIRDALDWVLGDGDDPGDDF